MRWWTFTLTLADGQVLDWMAAGASPTDAIREVVYCWVERLGDSALFSDIDLISVVCDGPLVKDAPTLEYTTPDDSLEVCASPIGDTSQLRAIRLTGR